MAIIIIALGLGYILGQIYSFPLWDLRKDISGDIELRVMAVTDKGQPVENLAIGLSRKPYAPPDIGGEQYTNKEGVAIFRLKAGEYYLGVGNKSIPQDLEYRTAPFRIDVREGAINEQRITLYSRETKETRTVKLYYYNPGLDRDEGGNIMCSRNGLVAVERKIPLTNSPIKDTLNLLLKGELTQEEKARGITTEFPLEGLKLAGVNLKDGLLTLTFDDPLNKTSGGSCRVGILWFQIESTAKQFPEVKEVRFFPEELFQP